MLRTKKIFAICDLDERYVVRLTSYLNEKKMTPFEILAFTSLDSLVEFAGSHPIEILLISREEMCDKVKSMNVSRILVLSDGEEIPFPEKQGDQADDPEGLAEKPETSQNDYPSVYKYQSTESLAREVMNYYSGRNTSSARSLKDTGILVYAVCSPIARCGKTMFSLALSEILAEKKKTLYLNLENYSGFEALFGQTYRSDLTDLVYLSRKNEGSLPVKLENVIRTMRNADYIPPAFFPGDLREIEPDEWISFLSSVTGIMKYEAVVLDIGSEPSGIPTLLSQADHIYMPVLPDPLSRAKLSQYEKNMEALSMDQVMERTVRLYLPEVHPRGSGLQFLESLLSGEMGTYTRKLLAEEGRHEQSAGDSAGFPGRKDML